MQPPVYDLYFTASLTGNPRQCIILGEDQEPIFYRFETPEVYMTNTRTIIYRREEQVATFDWTASNYLGLATVKGRKAFPMTELAQEIQNSRSRTFQCSGTTFEWRRVSKNSEPLAYNLYSLHDQGTPMAIFRSINQATPIGPSHGFMQYNFLHPPLLLEALLALCINRWIDSFP